MENSEKYRTENLPNHIPQEEKGASYLPPIFTKREFFAGLAMQGILANTEVIPKLDKERGDFEKITKASIMLADELINQLNK